MRERVARLSERPLALGVGAASQRIEVVVSSRESTWQAIVALVDQHGRTLAVRTVQGRTPSCGSVDVAVAVVIATMLDGLPVQAAPVRDDSKHGAAADGGREQLGVFIAASPNLIPSAWLGGGLDFLLGSAIPVLLEATVYAPGEQTDSLGRGARFWGFHAGGGICPEIVRGGEFDLRVCATVQAGIQFASGVGLTANVDSNLPIVLLKLGPKLRYQVTETASAQLGVSAAWVIVRPTVHWEIEETRRELTSDPFALLAQIGFVISME
jgi:hypothetical protein